MPTQIKRSIITFLAKNYRKSSQVQILAPDADLSKIQAQPKHHDHFVQRWYLSLQGEDNPAVTKPIFSRKTEEEQVIYRYDWAFGVTMLQGFWWDWIDELCDVSSLAVHITLEPMGNAPEAVPISATLSALHPSRNTKGFWELAMPKIPKAAAEMARIGASALPVLNYASTGLMMASNMLDSYSENQKNWFLYQFFDDRLNCPTVEWRINKEVINEYGPLLRGTLFPAFYGSTDANPDTIRLCLRPQIRFCEKSELDFIVPTDALKREDQVCLEVRPREEER